MSDEPIDVTDRINSIIQLLTERLEVAHGDMESCTAEMYGAMNVLWQKHRKLFLKAERIATHCESLKHQILHLKGDISVAKLGVDGVTRHTPDCKKMVEDKGWDMVGLGAYL